MNRLSLILSTLLLTTGIGYAEVKVTETKDYVGNLHKSIEENSVITNTVKIQKMGDKEVQLSNLLQGYVTFKNDNDYLRNFKLKVGMEGLGKFKGDYLINYKTSTDQKTVRAYGAASFNFFDNKLGGNIGIFKMKTPLINYRTESSIYDTLYSGGIVTTSFNIENYSAFSYIGYISHADVEMTGNEEIQDGLYTAGIYLNDNINNEMNGQLVFQTDEYYQVYGDIINTINDKIKIKSQFLFEDTQQPNSMMLNNYIVGGKLSYLYDKNNFFSVATTMKKDKSKTGFNTYFHNNNAQIYTNGLYYNPLDMNERSAIKISYKNMIGMFNNHFSLVKYFDKFDDNMFDENAYEMNFNSKFSISKWLKNTQVILNVGYVNQNINNNFSNFKILRADFLYTF